ncbi:MAG: glycosyltransferase family 4 protein [Nitrosopumilus sp.]|nr:glycosyltransferase family 4 protein [Nitrosopumilus sp.]MDH3487473.1 glycosyltransferase family 4 protein [Nitrosopumilus sp.]
MKIGIVHPSFDVIGGAEQTTLSLLDALKNTSHQVTLYTTTKSIIIPSEIKICYVNKNSFPIGWNLQRLLEVVKLFKKAKNEDVLFVSSGNLVLSNIRKVIIIYCHSTFESELKKSQKKNSGLFIIYHNYIKKRLKNQLKLLEKVNVQLITNSNYTKEKFKEIFGKESKVIFPPVKLKERNKDNCKKYGIITISRYSPEKNLEYNLEVIKNLNIPYKIFGNAKFSSQINYYNHLQKLTNDQMQIELFCNSKRDLIENSLNSSKIYFQSSKETFGISVIEGIMAGCIPIVPNNTANKEIVPINKLRYKENDKNDAKRKIEFALRGDFDKYLIELQEYVKKFSQENFQKNIINYLDDLENRMNKENRNNNI